MRISAMIQIANKEPATLKSILASIDSPSEEDTSFITKAYAFAEEAHKEQKRYSGDPYITHLARTAEYLAKIGMGPAMIAAGLLHDSIEDAGVEPEAIEKEFGADVRSLVEGVTKLGSVRYRGMKRHTESLRKLFAATSQDVRVMIIKLMDRLHNARTLAHVPDEDKRRRIALETIEIYAPIADRLGMGVVKRELEDAAFPHAYKKEYESVHKIFKDTGGEDMRKLEKFHNSVRKKIAEYGVEKFRTDNRIKGLYSLFRKLERKGGDVSKIHDIWALRIIVPTISDCYTVLGIIHSEWKPMPGKIKDYIAFPKPNGYRSIHTTIHTGDGGILEIQIRTEEMHREAQFGIASHFSYKEVRGDIKHTKVGSGMSWIRQFIPSRLLHDTKKMEGGGETARTTYTGGSVPEWIKHVADIHESDNPDEFLNDVKTDFFSHRVFVFTPHGDVVDLPIDSCPIDFAYAIHSDIGNHMSGAKVNGKLVSLDTKLHNGDMVEIVTSAKGGPTRKWLEMAKTTLAKRHIKSTIQSP
ncbi:MAG: HD domain-containing protein [bacterium]|nr:HD domain-containing protein [bacterium]